MATIDFKIHCHDFGQHFKGPMKLLRHEVSEGMMARREKLVCCFYLDLSSFVIKVMRAKDQLYDNDLLSSKGTYKNKTTNHCVKKL